MNKKGFTLIELIVSVILVSVVMVSLSSALVDIKNTSVEVQANTDVIITSSAISRVLNNDVVENNGIRYVKCDPNGEDCGFVLGNNKKRALTLQDVTDATEVNIGTYDPETNTYEKVVGSKKYGRIKITKKGNKVIGSESDRTDKTELSDKGRCNKKVRANCLVAYIEGSDCRCISEEKTTSLLYQDISADETTNLFYKTDLNGATIYVKTLSIIRNTNPEDDKISTEGYTFSKLNYKQTSYDNKADGGKTQNVLSKVSIGIYDGIDKNDDTYSVFIYSSATIENTAARVGNDYTISLNTNVNYRLLDTDTDADRSAKAKVLNNMVLPKIQIPDGDKYKNLRNSDDLEGGVYRYSITKLNEKYNVGFESSNHRHPDQILDNVKNIIPPNTTAAGSNKKTFLGYYYNNGHIPGYKEDCAGIKVIDKDGNILVAPNYFTADSEIYACWEKSS